MPGQAHCGVKPEATKLLGRVVLASEELFHGDCTMHPRHSSSAAELGMFTFFQFR